MNKEILERMKYKGAVINTFFLLFESEAVNRLKHNKNDNKLSNTKLKKQKPG